MVTALAERDAVTAACEAKAGAALAKMVDDEGLTVAEVVEWCGSETLTAREVARLRAARPVTASAGSRGAAG